MSEETIEIDRETLEKVVGMASAHLSQAKVDGAEEYAEENREHVEKAKDLL